MKLELYTMAVSHFCEKARWALQRAGLRFVEHAYAPLLHYRAMLHGARRSLPALVTPHGTLRDSTEILAFVDRVAPDAGLLPESDRDEIVQLEEYFDERLGPHTRRWAYSWALHDRALLGEMLEKGLTPFEARLTRAARPLIIAGLIRGLGLGDRAIDRAQVRIAAVFELVGERIKDRPYLVGDRFTAADLTFAALGAPAVLPPTYAFGLPPLDRLPEDMRRAAQAMRSTAAGDFVMRLYRDHRGVVV